MEFPMFLYQFLPALIPLLIFLVLYAVLAVLKKVHSTKRRRTPFTGFFLRSPGESLRWKLRDLNDEVMECLVMILIIPLLFYSVLISHYYFNPVEPSRGIALIAAGFALCFIVYFIFNLVRALNVRRKYRLGYDGELAAGQELNQLMLEGYHVFHDVEAEGFNIDHVVAGPSGIYAFETKARTKPTTSNRSHDAKVLYDGSRLQFPSWIETKPMEQARRQAAWLSTWLSSAAGEAVHATPVVTLPGWFVERIAPGGIPVINPKQARSLLNGAGVSPLDPRQITRIVHQLNQRCRDVLPGPADGLGGAQGLQSNG